MLFRGAGCLDLFRHVLFCGIMGGQIEKGLYGFEYSWLRRGLHATMAKGHGSFCPKLSTRTAYVSADALHYV